MAISFDNKWGWMLTQATQINRQYSIALKWCPSFRQTNITAIQLRPEFFSIFNDFRQGSQSKGCQDDDVSCQKCNDQVLTSDKTQKCDIGPESCAEIDWCARCLEVRLKNAYQAFKNHFEANGFVDTCNYSCLDNSEARQAADEVDCLPNPFVESNEDLKEFSETAFAPVIPLTLDLIHLMHYGKCDLVNKMVHYSGSLPIICNINKIEYVIPAKSSFLCSDISNVSLLFLNNEFHPYDFIVIDPPWENKSIKRKKKYCSMKNEDLKSLPVPQLSSPGCIIVIWVTNRQAHHRFIVDTLFPLWSIKFLAKWHWIKITAAGNPVLPFDNEPKKPYECLIIGEYQPGEKTLNIPDQMVLCSIPSSIHSSKPCLFEVFSNYLKKDPRCLELFARNLQENWTSWGNEVLKHQNMRLFTAYD